MKRVSPLLFAALLTLLLTLTITVSSARAEDSEWVSANPASPLSVRISPTHGNIEVKLAPGTKQAPRKIEIRFFDQAGNTSAVELSAILPSHTPEMRYQGPATSGARSFVGFEIRIPFRKRSIVHSSRDLQKLAVSDAKQ